jgi:hypothetical protein
VAIVITESCHSRKRSAPGILLKTKKDSGRAGMTAKTIAQLRYKYETASLSPKPGFFRLIYHLFCAIFQERHAPQMQKTLSIKKTERHKK